MNVGTVMRKMASPAAAILLLAAVSCGNPFGGEETGSRFTPVIDDLSVSAASVLCDRSYTISFEYHDNQDDINLIHLIITGETHGGLIIETLDWDDTTRVDHTSATICTVTCSFDCVSSYPSDRYTIKVTVQDEREHRSNELTGQIRLQ